MKVEGMESQGFRVRKGVRQGCTLSPWLFNVFIDKVASEGSKERVCQGSDTLHRLDRYSDVCR